ncbi:MAG: LmbE family protein [Bacteroidetes bacterium]|jgi:LmbE family N-acetylglucosaminyl deacetylase|nr:LmbE family protein [Bacteroidota bacterium]
MKFTAFTITAVFILLFSTGKTSAQSKSEIQKLSAEETFPKDDYLDKVIRKKAMIVTAHDDDDDASMAGTIAMLNEQGWEIKQICFTSGDVKRDEALIKAGKFILDEIEFINVEPDKRRIKIDNATEPYMPIPKKDILVSFNTELIFPLIIKKINEFEPTVIFSLDNEMGGYGHPEHILVSQMLVDSFAAGKIHPERIYQSVYSNSMEKKILEERLTALLKKWGYPSSYMTAREMYDLSGMPEPDVEINIENYSKQKMDFLRSFEERERKTIAFFIPYFQDFKHKEYFSILNKEFFRVIK